MKRPAKKEKRKIISEGTPQPVFIERPVPLMTYILLNLIFWAYCAIQLLVLKWLLRDVAGLYFFFAVLAGAFTIVSIYDFLYDRLSGKILRPETDKTSSTDNR
ncbi:MAG: hypothetical protein N2246_02940 [Candidatus Sumerlaeia bacterium]|nr:hypothetical protein [Candidatus Sumerlaeia bacterium]